MTESRCAGFNLFQLIVTLAVASILMSLGIPQWGRLVENNLIAAERSQMSAALQFARHTAVTERQTVALCPSVDSQACSGDYLAWHQGYVVIVDENGNKQRDTGERVLRRVPPARAGVKIQSSTGRKALRYRMDGTAWGSNVTLRLCVEQHASLNRAIIVHGSGRIRLSDTMSNGKPVTCE